MAWSFAGKVHGFNNPYAKAGIEPGRHPSQGDCVQTDNLQ